MIIRVTLVALVALSCTLLDSGQARAQYGAGCGGYGYGFDVGRLYGVLAQNVPYYAAFPPVYYSAPVPRTYGYSPFAYPPGTRTPDLVESVAAKEINPYAQSLEEVDTTEAMDQVTTTSPQPVPLAVINPYVQNRIATTVSLDR